MPDWTSQDLDRIGSADEIDIAPCRPDGALRSYTTIWVVRVGDDLQHPGQVQRPLGQVAALQAGAGRRVVPGGEHQVHDVEHGLDALRQLGGRRHPDAYTIW